MLEDTANVVQGSFTQPTISVACKCVLTVFENRLMHVHTRAIITHDWLRHKGGGFAVHMSRIVNRVFKDLDFIGLTNQGVKNRTDFTLTTCCHFMVMHFSWATHGFRRLTHRRT